MIYRLRSIQLAVPTASMFVIALIPMFFSSEVLRPSYYLVQDYGGTTWNAYWTLLFFTLRRAMTVVTASFVVCFSAACLLVLTAAPIARALQILTNGMRFVPAIAWLPLTIAIVGLSGITSQAVFVALGVCPVVLFHLLYGLNSCPSEQLWVAHLSGASRWATFRFVQLPSSVHDIQQAIRLGMGLGFVLTVVHEYLFPDVAGVARIVELLELTRYTTLDGVLITVLLMALGLFLDSVVASLFGGAEGARGRN